MIERGQVFNRSAAASNYDDFDFDRAAGMACTERLVKMSQARDDLTGCRVPLNLRRINQHVGRMVPPRQNVQNVTQGRALWRSDDADALRQWRDRLLPRRVKQAFGLKTRFELFKRQLERAGALRLHEFGGNLQ